MIRRNWHTQWTKSTNLTLIDTGRDSNIFLHNPMAASTFLCLLFGRRFEPLHSNLPWKEEVTSRQEGGGRREPGNVTLSRRRENGHASFPALAAASSFHPARSLMLTGRGKGHLEDGTWEANLLWHRRQGGQWWWATVRRDANYRNWWSCFCSVSRFQISWVLIRQASFQLCQLLGRCWHVLNPVFIGCYSLLWQHTCVRKCVYSQHA